MRTGKKLPPYSVLMSVYYREQAPYLQAAAESMLRQSVPPEQFVLVCDGPLGEDLNRVIETLKKEHGGLFTVVRLPENKGLANALNQGLVQCRCDYVARMDSDDISLPERVERQLTLMTEQDLDICGTAISEFAEDETEITSVKQMPETQEEILLYAKKRNPFNHPSVVFRKSAVEQAGGYEEYPLFEDYQLWLRLLCSGARGGNLSEPLLKMRTGAGMYERRGGFAYFRHTVKMERFKRKCGMTGFLESLFSLSVRFVFCVMPAKLRAKLYGTLLRQ